jgi:hypothetical protein
MLFAALFLAATLADRADKDFKPFVFGGEPPEPAPAAMFDRVRDGMTLRELVNLLGPGHIPQLSGTGTMVWWCVDGRTLRVGYATDPKTELTTQATPGRKQVRVTMWNRDRKPLVLPVKGK